MKKCPFCAEEIQDEAVKCRYCGETMESGSEEKAADKPGSFSPPPPPLPVRPDLPTALDKLSRASAQMAATAAPVVTQLKSAIQGNINLEMAGFWRRTFAFCVDALILCTIGALLTYGLIVLPLKSMVEEQLAATGQEQTEDQPAAGLDLSQAPALSLDDARTLLDAGQAISQDLPLRSMGNSVSSLFAFLWEVAAGIFAVVVFTLTLLVLLGYYAGFESSRLQATPGKLLLGIRVAGVNGGRISYRRAAARNLAKLLFCLFPVTFAFLGYAFFSKRRGLHDLCSGCKTILRLQNPEVTV